MYFLLTIVLASVCFIGDSILKVVSKDVTRAFVDNFTHSLVAIISWLIVALKCHKRSTLIINSLFELFICGSLASIIDVDHFIMAKSINIKSALNLGKRRPALHCTSIPVVILTSCLAIGWFWDSSKIWRFGWLTWVSLFSHHLRDGSRRGIWLWPFGSTPPVPVYMYMLITLLLPYLVMIPLREYGGEPKFTTIEYTTV